MPSCEMTRRDQGPKHSRSMCGANLLTRNLPSPQRKLKNSSKRRRLARILPRASGFPVVWIFGSSKSQSDVSFFLLFSFCSSPDNPVLIRPCELFHVFLELATDDFITGIVTISSVKSPEEGHIPLRDRSGLRSLRRRVFRLGSC